MEEQSQHKDIHVFEEASNAESRLGGKSSKILFEQKVHNADCRMHCRPILGRVEECSGQSLVDENVDGAFYFGPRYVVVLATMQRPRYV